MANVLYTAEAHVTGGRADGHGRSSDGALADLNRALAEKIRSGEADLATPGLAEHLWQTTLAKLAVDQPNYGSYRREMGTSQ